ncbi:MAG TPA: patatin-like phospholipase family protein [Sphaerochaeta sp.]|nr:patatin-like phospholipase family protein [Sphaerochaeta sp.]
MENEPKPLSTSTQPRYILSLDGGGMRGIVPAVILDQFAALLKEAGDERPFYSHFDLVAGTSTGALLSLALTAPVQRTTLPIGDTKPAHVYGTAQPTFLQKLMRSKLTPPVLGTIPWGVDMRVLAELYREQGTTIFPRSQGRLIGQIFVDKYDEAPLEEFLQNTFGDLLLSEAVVPTLIVAYDSFAGTPYVMRSGLDEGFLFWEAARASSAAPTYFKPAYLRNRIHGQMHGLIDGGVVANNPALYAYIEAKRLYPNASKYHILSLSTANRNFAFDTESSRSGVIGWIDPTKGAPIQRIYASAQMQIVDDIASSIDEVSYTRIHSPLPQEYKLDEVSLAALDQMSESAQEIFDEHKQVLQAYAELLAERTVFDQLTLLDPEATKPEKQTIVLPKASEKEVLRPSLDSFLKRINTLDQEELE